MIDYDALKQMLIEHEGFERKPYRDTVGKLTIGIGRNLDDVGITRDEALFLLDGDIERVVDKLEQVQAYRALDDVRKMVLIDMAFNLGVAGLMRFKRMWAALERGDMESAAEEMLDSKWARQVGRRAQRLAAMMSGGEAV